MKRLIDRILVEDFGQHDVEFVFGQDERIDPSAQAQILTAYVGAGILTRNEARMKLGLAPVEDSAANEVAVTTGAGAAPVTTAPAQSFVKYDPNQPRDERGRWTSEAGGASPSGSRDTRVEAAPQSAETSATPDAALAFSDPENPHNPAHMIGNALDAILNALDRYKSRNEPPPTAPSSKPREEKGNNPPAPPVSQTPAAAAGAPNPEDGDRERQRDVPKSKTPRKPSYKIGASDGGPGEWAKVNESLTPDEAAYQEKATGAPRGTVYNVSDPQAPKGVTSFDGYDPETNTLIDAKLWNKWPIERDFSTDSVMEQVERQIRSAKGTNIVWKISSPEMASKLRVILRKNKISGIAVEFLNP